MRSFETIRYRDELLPECSSRVCALPAKTCIQSLLLSLLGKGDLHGVRGRDLEALQPRHRHTGLHVVLQLHKRNAWSCVHHTHLRTEPFHELPDLT